MSVTYTVKNLIRNDTTGIVTVIQYDATKEDGQYKAVNSGIIRLDPPEGTPIPYDQLTPAIVDGWLKAKLSAQEQTSIEKILDNVINREKNPPAKQSNGLPWSK